jgi:hypothetical protein
MTSILNLFSNFNDLTKPKSVTDNVTEYKGNISTRNRGSIALNQGTQFKKYQDKIINNLEQRIQKGDLVEGFEGLELNKNGLTNQTINTINKTDFSSQQQIIKNLKNDYDNTLKEYQTLNASINGNLNNYIDRVNPNNPYLGKVIQLKGGELFYVTNQGIAKQFVNLSTYQKMAGKNGLPPVGELTPLSIPWDNSYQSTGATIPTKPPLITGTPIQIGQSVGNEGSNVYVNSIVKNPIGSYIGCYNNLSSSTGEIMFSPKMNSSNNVNGYVSAASSVFQNNNDSAGSWCAFDQNKDTCWNSGVYSEIDGKEFYDKNNGNYIGQNTYDVKNTNGSAIVIKGESLQLNLPKNIPLTRYELQGCGNSTGTDPGTWYVIGYNGTQMEVVDFRENEIFNLTMKSFNVSNPKPYSNYTIVITMVGDPKASAGSRTSVQIAQWSLYTGKNSDSTNPAMSNVGQLNFDQCQNYAVNSGNKYFGLQTIDNNGVGNCMISNDLAEVQIYGKGINYVNTILWQSNTTGNNLGSTANFYNGSLNVLNSSGASIFSTPNNRTEPSNYIGCYADRIPRAMPIYKKGTKSYNWTSYNYEKCQQIAVSTGSTYFGLQDSTSGENALCSLGNNLSQAQKYGVAKNCTKISDGSWSGGAWSNAVYSTETPTENYFLILQDDGNMCIYLGSSPSDNQGLIWETKSNGKQQNPNPNFTAVKGKYGKNWISNGSTLAPGDFVGSTDGSIYFIMQNDGNLVLYTSSVTSKCSNVAGKTVGAEDTNALYEIITMGNKDSIGKLAYIDQNSELHSYPSNNVKYSDAYTTYIGIDSSGNDISGAAYGNSTVEKCKASCNSNDNCAGFTFSNNVCYPKTSSMFPNGSIQTNKNVNLYTRDKGPINQPIGVPGTVKNIDSITYDNYKDGGAISKSYGFSKATATQKQQLEQLESKLNLLTSQINGYTNKFSSATDSLNNQSYKNMEGLGDYLKDFKKTKNNIKNFNTNIENILNDSDITVLQKNYDYLFWSILATGTVLVTMNIAKTIN